MKKKIVQSEINLAYKVSDKKVRVCKTTDSGFREQVMEGFLNVAIEEYCAAYLKQVSVSRLNSFVNLLISI